MSGIDSLWHWWDVCMRALVYLTLMEPDGMVPSPYWGLDIWMYRIDDLSWREREWRGSGRYKALYIEAGKGISSRRKNEGMSSWQAVELSQLLNVAACSEMFCLARELCTVLSGRASPNHPPWCVCVTDVVRFHESATTMGACGAQQL